MSTAVEQPVRVLVVEDEEAHAELARRAFESHGKRYEVLVASSVKEAIALLAQSDPHLVLSDWRLPDGRGTDLFPEKRAAVPIVVMTSHGDEQVAVEAMKSGALDYVIKSEAAFGELPHVVERALREWHLLRERERSRQRLQAQYDFISILAKSGDISDVFPKALTSAAQFAEASRLEYWMLDPPEQTPPCFSWCQGDELASATEPEGTRGSRAWITDLLQSARQGSLYGAPEEQLRVRGFHQPEHTSVYLQPIFVDERPRALLVLFGQADQWLHDKEFDRFVGAVSTQLSGFLQRASLQTKLLERERLAGLGTAAAMFAHEVGNPLNSMYLHAQLLSNRLRKVDAPTTVAEGMQNIMGEIRRLETLLKEFRSLSHRRPLHFEDVSVASLVTRVLDAHVREHAEPATSVEVDFPASLPTIHADSDKLVQVFLNLFKNAIEAMPDGGTLFIRGHVEGQSLVTVVGDTGPGLPEGVDVFQLFKTTKPQGTGLGLPVVQQIIAAHGGSVRASNSADAGAEFTITLPLRGPKVPLT